MCVVCLESYLCVFEEPAECQEHPPSLHSDGLAMALCAVIATPPWPRARQNTAWLAVDWVTWLAHGKSKWAGLTYIG